MAEGHKRRARLSNYPIRKRSGTFPASAPKKAPRGHTLIFQITIIILLKKGKDRRQRVKSRTSPNEFSSSICRHTYHQSLHKTSKQKMELFFDANKIFVPSNATKAPDISCFIYIFSGAEGVRKTRKQYIASGDVPKNCLSFKRDKDAA